MSTGTDRRPTENGSTVGGAAVPTQDDEPARSLLPIHDHRFAVARTGEIVSSKWTVVIVHDLSEGPRRFSELERACRRISPRTLSERLHMLEREGIVLRHDHREHPPRVDYELTEKGQALLAITAEMRRFGQNWPCKPRPQGGST